MADPADAQDPENHSGGWYELALELRGRQRKTVDSALDELSQLAEVEPVDGGEVVRLPDGQRVVCKWYKYPEGRSLWLVFGLPLGSLARADARVGAYPFDDSDTGTSWRPAVDAWLASLAVRLFDTHPFSLALVGMEASGELLAAQLRAGVPAEHSHVGIVTVTGGRPTYHPATPRRAHAPATSTVPAGEGGRGRAWTSWWRSWRTR